MKRKRPKKLRLSRLLRSRLPKKTRNETPKKKLKTRKKTRREADGNQTRRILRDVQIIRMAKAGNMIDRQSVWPDLVIRSKFGYFLCKIITKIRV